MKFSYPDGIASVEAVLPQAIRLASMLTPPMTAEAMVIRDDTVNEIAYDALQEIRSILIGELKTLADTDEVAREWNECLRVVERLIEGTLP